MKIFHGSKRSGKTAQMLRDIGDKHAREGKPIDAFYNVVFSGFIRHNETNRALYEIGYRAAKDEMRKAAKNPS